MTVQRRESAFVFLTVSILASALDLTGCDYFHGKTLTREEVAGSYAGCYEVVNIFDNYMRQRDLYHNGNHRLALNIDGTYQYTYTSATGQVITYSDQWEYQAINHKNTLFLHNFAIAPFERVIPSLWPQEITENEEGRLQVLIDAHEKYMFVKQSP